MKSFSIKINKKIKNFNKTIYVNGCKSSSIRFFFIASLAYGVSRDDCIQKLKRALEEYVIIGVNTNIQLHQEIIQSEEFITGKYDINYMSKFD